jgi:hypothetical protein
LGFFRWRGGQLIQAGKTEAKLREVLTFPGGWLLDEDNQVSWGTLLDDDVIFLPMSPMLYFLEMSGFETRELP